MARWYVNAPGAKPVGYATQAEANSVAAQVKGGRVTKNRPVGRHEHPVALNSGFVGSVPSTRKSLW